MANLHVFGFLGLSLSFGAAIVLPLFAGCGSSVGGGTGGHGGGGSHAGGSHVGGSHAGGSHAGGAAPTCDALAQNAVATPVPVRLVNDTAANLYIRFSDSGECAMLPFVIKDPGGDELSWNNGSNCVNTCADANCGCTTTCGFPPIILIAPKGAITITWKGVVREKRTLPASCKRPEFCVNEGACDVEVAPKSFPLSFVGTAWTSAKCLGVMCTPCTPDASGTCELDNSGYSGDMAGEFVYATATYPAGGTSVDIVFAAP